MKTIKQVRKKVGIFFVLVLMLFQNANYLAWAQVAETATPELTPSESTPTITSTPSEQAESTNSQDTGNSGATLPTGITETPTGIPTINIPSPTIDTQIDNTNNGNANTGGNDSSNNQTDENMTNTGDAQAGVNTSNQTNNVENVGVNNTDTAIASTGNNTANDNEGQLTVITTGDAVAFVNLVNFLNSNVHDSQIRISIINLNSNSGDTDINQTWQELLADEDMTISPTDLQVVSGGAVINNNQVEVAALTGNNQANNNGGMVIIESGNAKALANVINLINANLVSSKYLISIVNITDLFNGNIILPRPDTFTSNNESSGSGNGGITVVENSVQAKADSGNNQTLSATGSNINTGVAIAVVNNQTIINATVNGNQFRLVINNLGDWQGKVWGWDAANSLTQVNGAYNTFASGDFDPLMSGDAFINSGISMAQNQISVLAISGSNQALGNQESLVSTGNSIAIANLFNFVNFNFYKSNNFLGMLNILGTWKGNLIFAYPDMSVGIERLAESEDTYRVTYKNQGYDTASDVVIQMDLPSELMIDGKTRYQWKIGDVASGYGGFIELKVEKNKNNIASIIKKVWAAENEEKLPITAKVFTSDPELDTANNQSEAWVIIYRDKQPTTDAASSDRDEKLPEISVNAKNNVNDFVYPEDTVTYEVNIKNTNDLITRDAILRHIILDKYGRAVTQTDINLGEIYPNEDFKINYGIPLTAEFFTFPGQYRTRTTVYGLSESGKEVKSNSAETEFELKLREGVAAKFRRNSRVKPAEAKVLGTTDNNLIPREDRPLVWPYVLLMISSAIWLSISSQKKIWAIKNGSWDDGDMKYMGIYLLMILTFGFASVQIIKTQDALSQKVESLTESIRNTKIISMINKS